jgi:hypothetical protein
MIADMTDSIVDQWSDIARSLFPAVFAGPNNGFVGWPDGFFGHRR